MTFYDEQIKSNKDWKKEHEGHKIYDDVEQFPIGDGYYKVMKRWVCVDCDKTHLYGMETTNKPGKRLE